MNTKAIIWYGLSIICLIIALIIFFRGLDIKALLFLVFGLGAVVLFRQGVKESQKK
jgi:hypothetical protein